MPDPSQREPLERAVGFLNAAGNSLRMVEHVLPKKHSAKAKAERLLNRVQTLTEELHTEWLKVQEERKNSGVPTGR